MRGKMKRAFFAIAIIIFCSGCNPARPSWQKAEPVDVYDEPQQVPTKALLTPLTIDGKEFVLTPQAEYKLAGIVVSKAHYWLDGWRTSIASYDLAVVWGDLAQPDNLKHVSFSQSGRWYWYHWDPRTPFGEDFIIRHSSNSHIIPANQNIQAAVAGLRNGQHVLLEGYLVNVDGSYGGGTVWWHTSLSREDTGDSSCEVFYVERLTADGQIFE